MKISLTTFVDFVYAYAMKQRQIVIDAKKHYSEEYDPKKDFYKRFRDAFSTCCENESEINKEILMKYLEPIRRSVKGSRKERSYRICIDGIYSWIEKQKTVNPINLPDNKKWVKDGLEINVNPEVALQINGKKYLIKLFLKDRKAKRVDTNEVEKGRSKHNQRCDIILYLLKASTDSDLVPAVLDVRESLFLSYDQLKANEDQISEVLDVQAETFIRFWDRH